MDLVEKDRRSIRNRASVVAFSATNLAAIAMHVMFPGDIQFSGDEAQLIAAAVAANADGRIVDLGLSGSFNYTYGPIPTQIYQLLLVITHDLRAIVILRAALFTLGLTAGLWALAQTLRLPRGLIPVILVCPWLWYFSRTLWDNTFCIPLGVLMLAAYARWLAAPTWKSAAAWTGTAMLLPLIHLFSTPLMLAVFAHAMVLRWRDFRRHLPAVAAAVLLASCTSWSYLRQLSHTVTTDASLWVGGYDGKPVMPAASSGGPASPGARPSRPYAASRTLYAATILTASQSYYRPPADHPVTSTLGNLAVLSRGIDAWLAVGVIVAIGLQLYGRGVDDLRRHVLLVALATLLIQAAMFATMRATFHVHYFGGVFAAVVVLAWVGAEWFWRGPLRRWFVIVPAAATCLSTLLLIASIHRTGGDRVFYGPTLGNVIELARLLNHFDIDAVRTDSGYVVTLPHALRTVRRLQSPPPAPAGATQVTSVAWIILRNQFPGDARLVFFLQNPFHTPSSPPPDDDQFPLVDVSPGP